MKQSSFDSMFSADKTLRDFPPARRYLIGLSGGRDSVALLHLLLDRGYNKLIICHLNHQLRRRSAAGDERFVERIAAAAGLDSEITRADVRTLAKQSNVSIETAGRTARFAFFFSVASRRRCHSIFLAHHRDDVVETALINFFRGAGSGGIAAMRTVSVHKSGRKKLTVVRPLLHVCRRDIDAYVKQQGLRFREDSSNAQLDATRNRVRHRILPYIERQFGRSVRPAIWRASQIFLDEHELLEEMLGPNDFTAVEIEVKRFRRLPMALQRRAIARWLRWHNIAAIGFELVENIRALTEPNAPFAKVNLPRKRYARRRAGKLFLE
jgi:tRNA(Ile)-lysidine synthase